MDNKIYEPIDWALNSATLAQFFMEKCRFKQARHHLAAASCILDKHEEDLKNVVITPEAALHWTGGKYIFIKPSLTVQTRQSGLCLKFC